MKSQIHENRKNKLLGLSKKVLMLIAVILGTSVMVSAKTTPAKSMVVKEVSTSKHHKTKEEKKEAKAEKKAAKVEKKAEVAKEKK